MGREDFWLAYGRDDGTVVVRVAGEIDAATAPCLRQGLSSVIDDLGSLSLRVDLTGMTFIDSTGLSVLVTALEQVRNKGGDMTLANPRPSALRLLEIVGLTQMFEITTSSDPVSPS